MTSESSESSYTTQDGGASVLHRLEPVRALSAMRQHELSALCATEHVAMGGDPFRFQGVQGQSVYLLSGELKLAFADGSVCVVVGGSDVALWPIAKRSPALVEAKAITNVELMRIDDDVLDVAMTWDQLCAGVDVSEIHPEVADWRAMSGVFRLPTLMDGALSRLPTASIDELFRRLDELHGDRVLRRAKRQENAVTELFPLFFRKFHSTHSNLCVQRARPPEGGARSRRIVFELYSICARRRARGQ